MAFVDLPNIIIHIKQQESFPVGGRLPAFVVLGVYTTPWIPYPPDTLSHKYPSLWIPYQHGYPTPWKEHVTPGKAMDQRYPTSPWTE